MGINLRTLTDDELLRIVDRTNPEACELAARLERVLYRHNAVATTGGWQQLELFHLPSVESSAPEAVARGNKPVSMPVATQAQGSRVCPIPDRRAVAQVRSAAAQRWQDGGANTAVPSGSPGSDA